MQLAYNFLIILSLELTCSAFLLCTTGRNNQHKLYLSERVNNDLNIDLTDSSPILAMPNQALALSLLNGTATGAAITMIQEARSLRKEIEMLEESLLSSRLRSEEEEMVRIDRLLDELLVLYTSDDKQTQILHDVDQVFERLKEGRYSPAEVTKIFRRICDISPQTRSNCSPLMTLLVEGVGKMDSLDIESNPNKRWTQKLENRFRKKLFQLEYGLDVEEVDEEQSRGNGLTLRF